MYIRLLSYNQLARALRCGSRRFGFISAASLVGGRTSESSLGPGVDPTHDHLYFATILKPVLLLL